jgi:hypothetical protein
MFTLLHVLPAYCSHHQRATILQRYNQRCLCLCNIVPPWWWLQYVAETRRSVKTAFCSSWSKTCIFNQRFDVLTAKITMNQVIWDMTPCWFVSSYLGSEGAFCLHFLGISSATTAYNFEPDADQKIQPAAQPGPRWQSWRTNYQKQWHRRRIWGRCFRHGYQGTRLNPQA